MICLRFQPGSLRKGSRTFLCWAVLALFAFLCEGWTHPGNSNSALAKVDETGKVRLRIQFDVLAFVLNDTPTRIGEEPLHALIRQPTETLKGELAEAGERLANGIKVKTSQEEFAFSLVAFPSLDAVSEWTESGKRFPVLLEAELETALPPGTDRVTFLFPEIIEHLVLMVERPGQEPWSEAIGPEGVSSQLPIHIAASGAGDVGKSQSMPESQRGGGFRVVGFLPMGFRHIFPEGIDHILFVLGLVLLNPRLRPLAWQVSAFTLAHSITLGVSLYGLVNLPAIVIEPLIALSIVFIGLENLFTHRLKPWRVALVFGFGLIHGLGFARALTDLGLARETFLSALIGFNAGVELGQLAVILLALLLLAGFRNKMYYRKAVAIPASGLITMVALFWVFQRLPGFS